MGRYFDFLLKWFIICMVTYLFLSLCNWSLNLSEWTGFSRFIIGAEGIIFIIDLINEL